MKAKCQNQNYDLIIIGAGCVGMAAAYYATKIYGKKVCLVQQYDDSNSYKKFWSSTFSARQNRVQYAQEYLTSFVVQSNKEWDILQSSSTQKLVYKEGSFWFGDKNANTNEGNIKLANLVLNTYNNNPNRPQKQKISYEYKTHIMEGYPDFMNAFKKTEDWINWSAIYQPDGGSIDMEASYNFFKGNNTLQASYYNINKIQYQKIGNDYPHQFALTSVPGRNSFDSVTVNAKKVLIATGVQTPFFLKNVMKCPELVDKNIQENNFVIQQYIASYFKVQQDKIDLFRNIPTYYNFMKSDNLNPFYNQYSGYGFPYHDWDQPIDRTTQQKLKGYVKLGTMCCKSIITQQQLKQLIQQYKQNNWTPDPNYHSVYAAKNYVRNHMSYLDMDDGYHYYCPIIFYKNRETILDYLYRNNGDIVVHSGGWVGKYYPLLAKTAIRMLFQPDAIVEQRKKGTPVGNFVNRTRFPIRSYVDCQIENFILPQSPKFEVAIIGAGSSGLYTAYRLKKSQAYKNKNVGVFQLSHRISGRLKSFYFQNTSTHFELGGMRYIPDNHCLVNKIIEDQGIPNLPFSMQGDPLQNSFKKSFLREMYYRLNQWEEEQKNGLKLMTTYKIRGLIVGMSAFQIICFSIYQILTAPWNIPIIFLAFITKTNQQIAQQKKKQKNPRSPDFNYREWTNYITHEQGTQDYSINMSLKQWNFIRHYLQYREDPLIENDSSQKWDKKAENLRPLYKFGFQNVIQNQFGHEAYLFVSDQNGYYSNTSNASYFDQVLTYVLDFGDVQYRTLVDGYDQINYNLANSLLSPSGFKPNSQGIYLGHKLINVEKNSTVDGKYKLTFHIQKIPNENEQNLSSEQSNEQKQAKKRSTFHLDNFQKSKKQIGSENSKYQQVIVYANKVVFAMPRKSISNLYHESQLLQQDLTNYNNESSEKFGNIQKQNKIQQTEPKSQIQELIMKALKQLPKEDYLFLIRQFGLLLQKKQDDGGFIDIIVQLLRDLYNFYKSIQETIQYVIAWFKSLKNFEQDPPIQPLNLLELADCTQQMPAIKIGMNFDRNWWDPSVYFNSIYSQSHQGLTLVNNAQEMRGLSNTDLPIRQTLYFALGQDNLLLGSYNDMITTQFWTTLQQNFKKQWTPTKRYLKLQTKQNKKNHIPNPNSNPALTITQSNPQSQYQSFLSQTTKFTYNPKDEIQPAKIPIVRALLRQLSLSHQKQVKQQWVKQVVFQYWGRDPFGAGYHNFYAGYDIEGVMKCMRKPWVGEDLHFVGEAYSNQTGWVQGAFQTAERMLWEDFGIGPLITGYYPGY